MPCSWAGTSQLKGSLNERMATLSGRKPRVKDGFQLKQEKFPSFFDIMSGGLATDRTGLQCNSRSGAFKQRATRRTTQLQRNFHQIEKRPLVARALHKGFKAEAQGVRHYAGKFAALNLDAGHAVATVFSGLGFSQLQEAHGYGHFMHAHMIDAESQRVKIII